MKRPKNSRESLFHSCFGKKGKPLRIFAWLLLFRSAVQWYSAQYLLLVKGSSERGRRRRRGQGRSKGGRVLRSRRWKEEEEEADAKSRGGREGERRRSQRKN